jgi:hypothetical protein
MLTAETVHTVVAAQDIAAKRGWDFGFNHVTGSIISEVRNIIVGMFLESGADQLLMLDSDQAASRATIDRMISFDKMLVGCIYPRRKFFWSQVTSRNPEAWNSFATRLQPSLAGWRRTNRANLRS